jgi:hypothetical protein
MAETTAASGAFIAQENHYGAHNYHPLDVICTKGEGVWLTDVDGKRYMDFLAAYSAVNQGHNHPRIAEAMIRQVRQLALTSRAFRNDQFPPLHEKLCRLTGFDKALLMNSGAEAVETAIKAMRKWAYDVKGVPYPKAEIIVPRGTPRPDDDDRRLLDRPRLDEPLRPSPPDSGSSSTARSRPSRPRSRPRRPPSLSSRSRARGASSSRPTATSAAFASWPTGTTAS